MARIQVRIGLIFGIIVTVCLVFLVQRDGRIPTIHQISDTAHEVADHVRYPSSISKLPKFHSPFSRPSHKPPVQANSTSGESSWFSDWKWKHPFSSTITLDENRAVLPPLKQRIPIYTFYDDSNEKTQETRKAEQNLLLMWRRAWWAQGFSPVVLGRPDAMNNPLYQATRRQSPNVYLEADLARWLAWAAMGGGILTDWLLFPMTRFNDHFMSFLRRGEYPQLSRYEGLRDAFFIGDKKSIENAILQVALAANTSAANSMADLLSTDELSVAEGVNSVAFYDRKDLSANYKDVADVLTGSEAAGLALLAELINAHIHMTWQNSFSKGIAILEPMHQYMAVLYDPAVELAQILGRCPTTPIASSCPPNNQNCRPCKPDEPMELNVKDVYRNESDVFSIGTVPHPYTTAILQHRRSDLSIRFIRRNTTRDLWLSSIMKHPADEDSKGGPATVVAFKEAVAGDERSSQSLWLTAEQESGKDLNWIFGFALSFKEPSNKEEPASTTSNIPAGEAGSKPPLLKVDWPQPKDEELEMEQELLKSARSIINRDKPVKIKVKDVVEAWNLLDTEAWHFAKAFSARRRTERLVWEEKEKGFAGADTPSKSFMRWFDGT